MSRRVLLLEIGAGDLPAATPTPQTASTWFPTPYVAPPPATPAHFAVTPIVGGVRARWDAVAGVNVVYELSRAPDNGGAPGTEESVYVGTMLVYNSNESDKTWWRVRTVVRGVTSAWSIWIPATPQPVPTPTDVQDARNAADSALANVPYVTNPIFSDGLNGWRVEPGVTGWGAQNALATSPNPAIPTYVSYYLGSASNTALRNMSCNPCQQGDVISATCQVSCASGGGTGYVRIIFYDAANTEMPVGGRGNSFTGTASGTSRATVTAPAGAVYFVIAPAVAGYTTGVFRFTGFAANQLARSQDEVPDGNIYVRSTQGAATEIVDNAGFELALNADGSVPGWAAFGAGGAITLINSAAGPYAGSRSLLITGGPGASNFGAETTRKYACTAGDSIYASCALYTGAGAQGILQVRFYKADGTLAGSFQQAQPSFNAWQIVSVPAVAPATAVYFTLLAFNPNTNGGTLSVDAVRLSRVRSIDTEVADGPSYGRTSQNDLYVSGGVNRVGLRVAGSGHRLGDQRNVPSSLSRAYGAVRSATALTVYSTGAVDVNAHTLTMGPATINYAAKSNAVTGLTSGQTYQIYTRDNYAGGTPTWLATTSASTANSFDDGYIGGSVTVPSTGSGGGGWGGGGGGCVHVDSWLQPGLRAKHVRWWQRLDCAHRGKRYRRWQSWPARVRFEPCVRIVAEGGATLVCSIHTPFDLPDGSTRFAPAMYGYEVLTDHGWRRVIDVIGVGIQPVMRIHVGGRSYAAGEGPTRIYSHNPVK